MVHYSGKAILQIISRQLYRSDLRTPVYEIWRQPLRQNAEAILPTSYDDHTRDLSPHAFSSAQSLHCSDLELQLWD